MIDRLRSPRAALRRLAPLFGVVLAACGGGGGSSAPPPPAPQSVLEGTAAVGAALSNANVSITDTSGGNACQQATIVTSGTGTFTCTLQAGKTAPFIVVVTDPSGAHPPQVSLATSTPVAGTPLVVNASPLTTAIVGQLAGGDALAVAGTPALIDVAKLDAVKAKVLAQLADVLGAIGAPAGYDPFTTPIVAATPNSAGNTADQVVDVLRISTVAGVTTVATIDNPAAAVPLADADTVTPPTLPAPAPAVTTLSEAVRVLAPALNNCFAVPAAQRVVQVDDSIPADQGGPEVLVAAAACQDITHPEYLHNGYRAGQAFYGLVRDTTMDGAVFSSPEIMLFLPDTAPGTADRAVLNLRFTDANGTAGNIVTVARRFAGSAQQTGRATDWYLYGNQQPVESVVRPFLRRNEQLAPNPGAGTFVNASASRFETGIEIFINKDGPGSAGMRAARVTGPGLPPAGLVYTRLDPTICSAQTWLDIRRKDGNTDPAAATYAPAAVGNIFRLQRTMGLAGADATAVRPNPNAGNSNNTAFVVWAHPLDYGASLGATDYIDFSALKANTTYQIEVFYDGETSARHTLSKTMSAPVVPAVNAGALRWLAMTPAALQYLDPAGPLAGAIESMTLAWTADPFAATIRSAGIYTFGPAGTINQGVISVPRGATSAVGTAPGASAGCTAGTAFAPLTADGTSGRSLQLRYRMLDNSYRDALWRFN